MIKRLNLFESRELDYEVLKHLRKLCNKNNDVVFPNYKKTEGVKYHAKTNVKRNI